MTQPKLEKPRYDWTKAANIINESGKLLQSQLGDEIITTGDIEKEVERLGFYKRYSVPPSDFCYNLINKYQGSFCILLFEWVERGKYRYLGPRFNYSGSIYWKGKIVGKWQNGAYELWEDPRN
jgi:hypothetical protein